MKNNLREAYDKKARDRDARKIHGWKIKERGLFLYLLLDEKKGTLLEIGAGTGKDSAYFQERGLEVICIDLSPENVKLCQQKGLDARVMDFSNLQFPVSSFDAVYALNCLLHLPKKELPPVLVAINRLLKSGGLFFMGMYGGMDQEGVWSEDSYKPKRFFSFYEDDHLKRILSQVFEIDSFKRIDIGQYDSGLHFQSMVLRKRDKLASFAQKGETAQWG